MNTACSEIKYKINSASREEIEAHLRICAESFSPPLFTYVDIAQYADKIGELAEKIEAWNQSKLIGLVAVYMNNPESQEGFVTNVSIVPEFQKKGIAGGLLNETICFGIQSGLKRLRLEVFLDNTAALKLYRKIGFVEDAKGSGKIQMVKILCGGPAPV